MSSAAELLLGEIRAKLDGQLSTMESIRTRAVAALSVSGVVGALFGAKLVGQRSWEAYVAIAAFVISSLVAIYALIPHGLRLRPIGEKWLKWATEHLHNPASGEVLALQMSEDMAEWYKGNQPKLKRLHWAIALAFVGVGVQLVFWVVALEVH